MLGRREQSIDRREGGDDLGVGAVGLDIGRQPTDPIIVADHDLEAPPAVIERPGELRFPLWGDRVVAEQPKGVELAAGDIGGRVRRQRCGVDGDGKSRLLHQPRGREAHHARSDHRDRAAVALEAELGGEFRAAPAERDPAAAVAVIVDQALLAELVGADDEARPSVRPEPGYGPDDAAFVGDHRRKRRAGAKPTRADRRAAGQQSGGSGGEGSAVDQHRVSLAAVRVSLQSSPSSGGRW